MGPHPTCLQVSWDVSTPNGWGPIRPTPTRRRPGWDVFGKEVMWNPLAGGDPLGVARM
jgi:hypothetical protein